MYHPFFVCIWLKNSIFGEFSNIYLLSAQNRVKWRHKIRPIAKNFRPILIFFAPDDAKLMPGEVCQVSCRYSNKWRSYSGKTEGGVGSDPPPRRWRVKIRPGVSLCPGLNCLEYYEWMRSALSFCFASKNLNNKSYRRFWNVHCENLVRATQRIQKLSPKSGVPSDLTFIGVHTYIHTYVIHYTLYKHYTNYAHTILNKHKVAFNITKFSTFFTIIHAHR